MKKGDLFYFITLITIIVIRVYLFLFPNHLIIFGKVFHHFWIGVILLGIGLLISRKYNTKTVILGIGTGLIIDEFVFIILGGGSFNEYWSMASSIGVIVLLGILFFFKEKLN